MDTISNEKAGTMHGISGRFFHYATDPERFAHQRFVAKKRLDESAGYDEPVDIVATLRFDDDCRNGHQTFTITGDVYKAGRRSDSAFLSGGCIHEDIVDAFPELAHLINWHLCSTDGPMHYPANALYLAGNRDYNGQAKGEPSRYAYIVRFGANPIEHKVSEKFWRWLQDTQHGVAGEFDYLIIEIPHTDRDGRRFDSHYTFGGYDGGYNGAWSTCPFMTKAEAEQFLDALQTCSPAFYRVPVEWSEGKPRELDVARYAAVWPDATDAELSAPREELKAALEARLPGLMADFRRDMEAAGLYWSPAEYPA